MFKPIRFSDSVICNSHLLHEDDTTHITSVSVS